MLKATQLQSGPIEVVDVRCSAGPDARPRGLPDRPTTTTLKPFALEGAVQAGCKASSIWALPGRLALLLLRTACTAGARARLTDDGPIA